MTGHRLWSPRTCKCHTVPWPRGDGAEGGRAGTAWQLRPSAGSRGRGSAKSPEEGSYWARGCSQDQHGNSSSKDDPVQGDQGEDRNDPTLYAVLRNREFLSAQKPTLQITRFGKFWLELLFSGQKSSLTSFFLLLLYERASKSA